MKNMILFGLMAALSWSSVSHAQVVSGKSYRIISTCGAGDKVVSVAGDSTANEARAVLASRDASKGSQVFKIESASGAYKLTAQHSGKALDVYAASKANEAPIIQWPFENSPNQLFRIQNVSSGIYRLQSVNSGLYVDVKGAQASNGTPLIQYQTNTTCAQRFKLEEVGSNQTPTPTPAPTATPAPAPTPAPAVSWIRCANEDGTCTFSGTRQVRYGLDPNWAYKTATNSIDCTNANFGDPRPGVNKVCDYSSSTTAGPAPTPAPAPTATPAPSPNGPYALGTRPFAPNSSWNTPVSSSASYTRLNWPGSTGYNYYVNWDQYSPAVHFSKSSDPLVQVSMPANWGWPAQTIGIRIATGVTGAAGTDGEILIIDGNTVHNCWQFKRTSNTTATCQAYGRADLVTGSGWGTKSPFRSAGIVATGSSQMAGLLVQAETDRGEIEHALQIALEFSLQRPGSTGEAISGDGSSGSGISQEGERLAIPRNVAMPSGLSPLGQKVFRALQKYGAFNIDVAGVTILRAQQNAYSSGVIDALRQDMGKLIPLLQKVN